MILKSFSKINLSLTINKKLKSGLHDIQSFFCLIDLYDEIKIKKIKRRKDTIKFKGKFAKLVDKKKNSISKILQILRDKNLIKNHYSVLINKKIPVFAGLGGGTSNAACLIKHLSKKKISKNLLDILEKKIGSDLKLFFYDQGFLKNLKTINSLRKKYNLYFLLVYPNIINSTKYIYSKVRKCSPKLKYNFDKINNKNKFISFQVRLNNELQAIVEKKYPIIRKLLAEIDKKKGCYFSRMTGSGSVCYGVFTSEKTAKAALVSVKSRYPKFWFSVAKTI
jgi:4-diphosphocytidyl-2-C-methyl-D-erythritol kinase